jgi:hypothetical protein
MDNPFHRVGELPSGIVTFIEGNTISSGLEGPQGPVGPDGPVGPVGVVGDQGPEGHMDGWVGVYPATILYPNAGYQSDASSWMASFSSDVDVLNVLSKDPGVIFLEGGYSYWIEAYMWNIGASEKVLYFSDWNDIWSSTSEGWDSIDNNTYNRLSLIVSPAQDTQYSMWITNLTEGAITYNGLPGSCVTILRLGRGADGEPGLEPAGAQGAVGDQGPTGPQGPPSPPRSAYSDFY